MIYHYLSILVIAGLSWSIALGQEPDCRLAQTIDAEMATRLVDQIRNNVNANEAQRYSHSLDLFCYSLSVSDRKIEAIARNHMGLYHYQKGDRSAALYHLQKSYALLKDQETTLDYAENQNYLGLLYHNAQQFPIAAKHLENFLRAARSRKDPKMIAEAQSDLGLVYLEAGDYDLAENYLAKAGEYLRESEDPYAYGYTLLNRGRTAIALGDHDAGLELLHSAVDLWTPIEFDRGLYYSYSELSETLRTVEPRQALQYVELAEEIALKNELLALGNIYRIKGNIHYQLGDFDRVIEAYQKCLDEAMTHNELELFDDAYLTLIDVYEQENRTEEIVQLAREAARVYNQMTARQEANNEGWLESQKQLVQLDAEIVASEQQIRERTIFTWILATLLVCSFGLLLLVFRSRQSLHRSNREYEHVNAKLKERSTELQESHSLVRRQKHELESFVEKNALLLAKKNNFRDEITQLVRKLDASHPVVRSLQERIRKDGTEVVATDVEYFTSYRNENFSENLLNAHPNLTETELRLCNYLRLNLSSKEIANLTFINPDSVKVARSRLRKKLGLTNKSESLPGYLLKYAG